MHNFIQTIKTNFTVILKILGIALVVIIILPFILTLLPNSLPSFTNSFSGMSSPVNNSESLDFDLDGMAKISSPAPLPPAPGSTNNGTSAEDFEITEYYANIKSHTIKNTCATIANLKALPYVIFNSATTDTTSCNYSFKVEHAHIAEVLATINGLDPENITANTYTIQAMIDSLESTQKILEQKLAAITAVLESAITAYDDITAQATNAKDIASLATIINSKVNLIQRLSQEKISINQELANLAYTTKDQLDRLQYTYFTVNITEELYFDTTRLKDSWQAAVRSFVANANIVLQGISIGLVVFLLYIVQYGLYLFIIYKIAAYSWRYVRKQW